MPMRVPNAQKVVFMELLSYRNTYTQGNQTWIYQELDIGEAEDFGPHLLSITGHAYTLQATVQHSWKLVMYSAWDVRSMPPLASPTFDVFAAITNQPNPAYAVQAPYTTTSNFGRKMKAALALRSASGAAIDQAVVGAGLAFEFRT